MFELINTTVLTTSLVLLREGFESVLLTGMIMASIPRINRNALLFNFLLTWAITLSVGWFAVGYIWPYIEQIESWMMLATAAILFYIYMNSKSIFEHVRSHVSELDGAASWTIHLTITLIALREALESTVFIGSSVMVDPRGTVIGLIIGFISLLGLVSALDMIGKSTVGKMVFRYMGLILLLMAVYYLYGGVSGIIEQQFGISLETFS